MPMIIGLEGPLKGQRFQIEEAMTLLVFFASGGPAS